MSFRRRLRLFFAIIVVVPMVAIGVGLLALVRSSEQGKADARIATSLRVAYSVVADGRAKAARPLRRLGSDPRLGAAIGARHRGATARRLRALVRSDPRIVTAVLRSTGGSPMRAGPGRGVAYASGTIAVRGGRGATLAVSVTDADRLAGEVRRRTGVAVAVTVGGHTAGRGLPAGAGYRTRRQTVPDRAGVPVELMVGVPQAPVNRRINHARLLIGALIAAFLLLALASSLYVIRSLQAQIAELLSGARRLAGGDFDHPVATVGDDEFAQLGREFNRMSDELRAKVEEVDRGRRQTEQTIRRVGSAFASGLDTQAVIELTVQTAVDACGADAGWAVPLQVGGFEEVAVGPGSAEHLNARRAAERRALSVHSDTGRELLEEPMEGVVEQRSAQSAERDGVHALAQALRARLASRTAVQFIGVVSIARASHPFSAAEVELLEYLCGQAIISVENAALHETVQLQALTDELTGLANVRELHGALDREFERGRRFETPVGFVLLDLDDFKQVNDTYGHLQGDQVLTEVGAALRSLCRDIDEPARYGGEELAVVLPQTDIEGAVRLAERMRRAVEALEIPLLDDPSRHVRVTASFGVASVLSGGADKAVLIGAADAALYRAKRAGKNRVERADPADTEPAAPAKVP
jgi:diguanylate cyclase (GGDEF)-like protein